MEHNKNLRGKGVGIHFNSILGIGHGKLNWFKDLLVLIQPFNYDLCIVNVVYNVRVFSMCVCSRPLC